MSQSSLLVQSITSSRVPYLGALVLTLIFIYRFLVYPLFVSPLRHVPGPKIAALTSLYINSRYYRENGIQLVKSLHDKYGPIVRVGPQEVVVQDPEQLSVIYGVRSTFPKPPFAALFANYGFPNAFSSTTREEHKERRRQVSKVYSMAAQLNNVALMESLRERLQLIKNLISDKNEGLIDIYPLATYFALDNVSQMVYGESFDLLRGKNLVAAEDIKHTTIASVPFVRFLWLWELLSVWPFSFLLPNFMKSAMQARDSLEALNRCQIEKVNDLGINKDADKTAVACMQSQPGYGKTLTPGHVLSECFDHVAAGADSTAASLIYIFHTLALPENRIHQDKLRKELAELPLPLDFKTVCALPYLNILVLESLRLNPPAPGSLQQRYIPGNETAALIIEGKSFVLPGSTLLGIQAYSLQRSETVFGQKPDEFRPERWESPDEVAVQNMKNAWIPFGTGARTCIGMNLALIEIKLMVAEILRDSAVELCKGAKAEDMSPIQAVVIRPTSERCDLVFKKVLSAGSLVQNCSS
ncbi:cytochrome P450 [Microthyrium microscopicum]|uniref:Cytochrome P450 n=1 Tax=Microthyrium microscopicum TaxID=703497 RepID=A0A6A6UNM0_9PEZI|nr:cytochrome P450 [Microthyrium microscopicum]